MIIRHIVYLDILFTYVSVSWHGGTPKELDGFVHEWFGILEVPIFLETSRLDKIGDIYVLNFWLCHMHIYIYIYAYYKDIYIFVCYLYGHATCILLFDFYSNVGSRIVKTSLCLCVDIQMNEQPGILFHCLEIWMHVPKNTVICMCPLVIQHSYGKSPFYGTTQYKWRPCSIAI